MFVRQIKKKGIEYPKAKNGKNDSSDEKTFFWQDGFPPDLAKNRLNCNEFLLEFTTPFNFSPAVQIKYLVAYFINTTRTGVFMMIYRMNTSYDVLVGRSAIY